MNPEFKKYKLNEHVTLQVVSYSSEMMTARIWFEGGGFDGTHHHPNEEVNIVVSGEFEATNGDRIYPVHPGQVVSVAPDVEHNMACLSARGEMVTVWTPARQDIIDKFTGREDQ